MYRVSRRGEGWEVLEPGQDVGPWLPLRAKRYAIESEAARRWGFRRWVRRWDHDDPEISGYELYIEVPDEHADDIQVIALEDTAGGTLIHRSTRVPGTWQITTFGHDGEPWGHREAATLQEALDDARWDATLLPPDALRTTNEAAPPAAPPARMVRPEGFDAEQYVLAAKLAAQQGPPPAPVEKPRKRPKTKSKGNGKAKRKRKTRAVDFPKHHHRDVALRMADRYPELDGWQLHVVKNELVGERLLPDRLLSLHAHREGMFDVRWVIQDDHDRVIAEEKVELRWSGDLDKDAKRYRKAMRAFLDEHEPADARRHRPMKRRDLENFRNDLV